MDFKRISRELFWGERPQPEPLGRRLATVFWEDINPATGQVWPDYLERRANRKAAQDAADAAPKYAGTARHDVMDI